jgi:hypothetical protein
MRIAVMTDGGNAPELNYISGPLTINEITTTSVSVDFDITDMVLQPTSYRINYQRLLDDGITNDGPLTTITTTSKPAVVTGLTASRMYRFSVTAYRGSQYGNTLTHPSYQLSKPSYSGSAVAQPLDPKKVTPGKSYFTLTNNSTTGKEYTLAYRDFSAIFLPSETITNYTGANGVVDSATNYSTNYYSFGTNLIMDSATDTSTTKKMPGAGFGFFVGANGTSGYFIMIESTASSVSLDRKSIRIVKVNGKNVKVISDTQRSAESTFDGVYGGRTYAIDVKVKVDAGTITIIAYINGFKITAVDKTEMSLTKGLQKVLAPTERVALLSTKGTTAFDYVYGSNINEKKYKDSNYIINSYQGQFSNDTLNMAFGEIVYDGNQEYDTVTKRGIGIDEFGTVVREIVKVDTKFDSRPAYPIKWSTGDNRYAKVLGYKVSNFGASAYVLNNTSTTIPLADGEAANFYIFGNTLGQSGTLEYNTEDPGEYVPKEPVIFESNWLQSESDVKSLADWIKNKVVNRGKVIYMEIFGNPLISVGDIITITYPYQGLAAENSSRFIVTNVNHSYNSGLETSIVCRTL